MLSWNMIRLLLLRRRKRRGVPGPLHGLLQGDAPLRRARQGPRRRMGQARPSTRSRAVFHRGGTTHVHEFCQGTATVRIITRTLPVAESRKLQVEKVIRDLDETRQRAGHVCSDYYRKKIDVSNCILRHELKNLQVLQQLTWPLEARVHI